VPTIVRSGGFEIRILTFDHPPAHVHGIKAGKKAKVEIADDVLLVKTTMSRPDTATLLALVAANLVLLQREWKKLHGPLR
jgi:hypothetical protein